MKNNFFATTLGLILLGLPVQASEIERNTAQMQAMDKITGRVSVVEVPVNSEVNFGSFSILVRACKSTPPEETPENYAFVDVADSSFGKMQFNIFKGWMMSSSPALNAVEHPIYDVWLLKCIDTKVDPQKLLSEDELKVRDALPKLADIKQSADKPVFEPMPAEEENTISKISENPVSDINTENKVLGDFIQPAEAEEQKAEIQSISLNEMEDKIDVEKEIDEKPQEQGPQSLLNIETEPKEQTGNDIPAAVEPATQNDDWVELSPAEDNASLTQSQNVEPSDSEALIVNDVVSAGVVSSPETQKSVEEVVGSVPDSLPEDEEDQFIDFSSQTDAMSALEAELSAEALKE